MNIDDFKSAIDKSLRNCVENKYEPFTGNCCSLHIGFLHHLEDAGEDSELNYLYREYCKSMGDNVETNAYWHDIRIPDSWKLDFEATHKIRLERLNGFREWLIANKKYEWL